jgi:hypothetical protein
MLVVIRAYDDGGVFWANCGQNCPTQRSSEMLFPPSMTITCPVT